MNVAIFICRGNSPQRRREHEGSFGGTQGPVLRRFGRRGVLRAANTSILTHEPSHLHFRGDSPQRHREHEGFFGVGRGRAFRRFERREVLRAADTSILKRLPETGAEFSNPKKRGQPLQQTFSTLEILVLSVPLW